MNPNPPSASSNAKQKQPNTLPKLNKKSYSITKNPAQDRLMKLQSKLKDEAVKKQAHPSPKSIKNKKDERKSENMSSRSSQKLELSKKHHCAKTSTNILEKASTFQTKKEVEKKDCPPTNQPKPNQLKKLPKPCGSAAKLHSPNPSKNIANTRLNNLRKFLTEQVKDTLERKCDSNEIESIDADIEMTDVEMKEIVILEPSEDNLFDDYMDWEPITEDNILQEITKLRKKNKEDLLIKTTLNESEISPLTVSSQTLIVVVDTNVWISHLKWMSTVINAKKNEHITYMVPYVVLQELDGLKRSSDKKLAQMCGCVIRFLNDKFKIKDQHKLKGQSSIDNNGHLIEIESADDKILNCCLQIQKKITDSKLPHTESLAVVQLLSNDINLRNKALISNIRAFSVDEFKLNITN